MSSVPALPDLSTIPIETALTLGFYAVLFFYVIFTAVFYYHWSNYSTNAFVTSTTYIVYVSTTIPLLILIAAFSL